MARAIQSDAVSSGDRAALKRWSRGQPVPLAFYRVWLRLVSDELPSEAQTPSWVLIAWGLAVTHPSGYKPGRPFGAALAAIEFSEARLERLLDAPVDVLPDLLAAAARHLASKKEGLDWSEPLELLLARSATAQESIRRRVAVAFYRHQSKE